MSQPYYRKKRRKWKSIEKPRKKTDRKKMSPWKSALIVVLVLFCMCGSAYGGYQALRVTGKSSLESKAQSKAPVLATSESSPATEEGSSGTEEGVYYYNGKKYRYNSDIVTILFMGIDQSETEMTEKVNSGQSGQADTIALAVMNPKKNKIEFINISRDTMTEVESYDLAGNLMGTSVNHLAVGYAMGDGREKSCEIVKTAVSNLFYSLPINAYCALNMEALKKINNSIGGVRMTLDEDFAGADYSYSAGQIVTLNGDQALAYIRARDCETLDSNSVRMNRQKKYAMAFMTAAKIAVKANPTLITSLYSELASQMVTDLSVNEVTYLASQILNMEVNIEDMHSLKGEAKQGEVYDEFYVDDKALLELILDIFYTEVRE